MSYQQIFNLVHTLGLLFAGVLAFAPTKNADSLTRVRILRGMVHTHPQDFKAFLKEFCEERKGECFDCPLRVCHMGAE